MSLEQLTYIGLAAVVAIAYGIYARYQNMKKRARNAVYIEENQAIIKAIADLNKAKIELKPKVEEYEKVRKHITDRINSNKPNTPSK